MFDQFKGSAKTAPSQYPKLPFHAIRCFQLLSSLIVGAIMSFFMYHLRHDDIGIPWTFIWLTAASLASVVALATTIFLHCLTGLNPRLNITINASLFVLWGLSWSLLTWYISETLNNMCDVEHWEQDVGIMVCRIYKALFTFTLLGLISTIAALGLDMYVRRQQTRRGIYRLQEIDVKRPEATHGPFTEKGQSYAAGGLAAPRESDVWEDSRPSMGPYNEQSEKYMAEEEHMQPLYDAHDTAYRGAQP